jgi:aspartokinase-like uncharacterized kinase
MSSVPLVIVKVGGSLLQWSDLPQRLKAWLANQRIGLHAFVAGAGPLGDFVRRADEQFQLGQERSHWLCVDALSLSARLLSHILGELPVVDSRQSLRELQDGPHGSATACVFDPGPFLRSEEHNAAGHRLPHTWDVTTDSIAARLADCLEAHALVLLKSCDPPPRATVEAASLARLVDRHFPEAAAPLARVLCVNLRDNCQPITLRNASHGQ